MIEMSLKYTNISSRLPQLHQNPNLITATISTSYLPKLENYHNLTATSRLHFLKSHTFITIPTTSLKPPQP